MRTGRTAHSSAAATSTTTATTSATTAATIATTAIAAAVPAGRLGPRHEIDDIEEVALLLGVRRRILAGQNAHEPDIVGAPAHHFQRLHQPREPIALDAHLLFDFGGCTRGAVIDGRCSARLGARTLRAGLFFGRGRRRLTGRFVSLARRRFGRRLARRRRFLRCRFVPGGFARRLARVARGNFARRFARLARGGFGRFARSRLGRRLARRRFLRSRVGRWLGSLTRGGLLGGHRRGGRRWRGRWTMGLPNLRRLAQDDAGELGDGLHDGQRPANARSVT
jgi:hypothetical protein